MTDDFVAQPAELMAVAKQMEEVGSQVYHVLASLHSKVASYGVQTWGDDGIGHKFANGPKGYLAQSGWVFSLIDGKSGLLSGYAESTSDAAKSFDQQENDFGA